MELEKIWESFGYELLVGFMMKGAEGTFHYVKAKHIAARIKGFRGWRRVKPALDSENEVLIKRVGLWYWYSHPAKTVTFID